MERWEDPLGRECGFSVLRDGQYWVRLHQFGTFVVQPGFRKVLGFMDLGVESGSFEETFLHLIAPWILQRHEWECFHASAVCTGSQVVVFCGPSGRGKSTMARVYIESGASHYADDAVPFVFRNGEPMAARIPQRLRLREPAASWFPEFPRPLLDASNTREVHYEFEPTLRPLSAVYWLEPVADVCDPDPLIERIAPADGFRLLISQAYSLNLSDPGCNRKMVRNYLSLARLSRFFRLRYPTGRHLLPRVLERLQHHQHKIQQSA